MVRDGQVRLHSLDRWRREIAVRTEILVSGMRIEERDDGRRGSEEPRRHVLRGGRRVCGRLDHAALPITRIGRLHFSTAVRRQSYGAGVARLLYPAPDLETLPDPNAAPGSNATVFIDPFAFDGSVFSTTAELAEEPIEHSSLQDYRNVISSRAGEERRLDWKSETLASVRLQRQHWASPIKRLRFTANSPSLRFTRVTMTPRHHGF